MDNGTRHIQRNTRRSKYTDTVTQNPRALKPIARARARENHARAPTRWRFAVIAVR